MQAYKTKITAFMYKYQLNDLRTVGLIVFAIVAAAVTYSGAKAIQINFELQKRVVTLQEQNALQRLENETQALRNEYYKTDAYKELAARRLFGRAAPGERVYVVPKEVAYTYVPETVQQTANTQSAEVKNPVVLPEWQQNIRDWTSFFFHRPPEQ